MNENNMTSKAPQKKAAKNFGFVTLGVIATVITAFAAKKAGYANIRIGRQSPIANIKEPAVNIGISIIAHCIEKIDPKQVASVIMKNLPK